MHNRDSIQNIFKNALSTIHKKRIVSLIEMASSLLDGGSLTVSSLGRNLSGNALEKSRIHRADSIIGSGLLRRDHLLISRALVDHFFQQRETLYVLIDGSGCCSDERFMIQASIANAGLGRSQPIHSIIYAKGQQAHVDAQDRLLKDLQFIFMEFKGRIVLITDAGFYSTWFNKVRKIGWDYVGRVRGRVKIKRNGFKLWEPIQDIYVSATKKAVCLGGAMVGRDNKARSTGTLYLIKKLKKAEKNLYLKKNIRKKNGNMNKCIETLGYLFPL